MAKKIIILGGSSGIGRATAIRFAQEGWNVMIAGLGQDRCGQVAQQLTGSGHIAVGMDVTKEDDVKTLVDTVRRRWQRFDVIVNSVGISEKYPVIDSKFSDWDTTLQVTMYGPVKAIRMLVPLINDGGRIISITSIHDKRVAPGSSAYGMSKAAMMQFIRSLAVELADRNILANAIAPGFVNTPMSIKAGGVNELETQWFKANYVEGNHLPLRRPGRPEEIAGVAWFLAGPDASYITGTTITVDGGLTITF